MVRLPGVDGGEVDALAKTLQASGATVNGQVTVEKAWSDPSKRTFREQALTNLGPLVGLPASDGDLEQRMGRCWPGRSSSGR
ncbi:hypothetical protein GCM10025868_05810 [Angustibacter aerolatus]|uniref:LytR/CpsA/Psr regulator C-terminal domain-containing protein n=1 Tax=Angustibacter aerolatus TaxID=1162965 RepID=A0ABQ6JAX2_9ACTN|nr:hypothetical protein GCM10025868_05810 [Angustibacter aerolatus]